MRETHIFIPLLLAALLMTNCIKDIVLYENNQEKGNVKITCIKGEIKKNGIRF